MSCNVNRRAIPDCGRLRECLFGLLELFDGLRVADVTDGMDAVGLPGVGLMDPAIHPLWKDAATYTHRFIGIAVTARYVPTNRAPAGRREVEDFDRWVGAWYNELSPEPFDVLLRPGSALVLDDANSVDVGSIGSYNIMAWQMAGAVGVVSVKQEVFPEFALDRISVSVPYLGAAPQEVEEGVVIKVEEAIQDVKGIVEINSAAREGMGNVTAEVAIDADINEVLSEVKTRVDAISTFPALTEKPVIYKEEIPFHVVFVSLYGDMDEFTRKVLAQQIRDELKDLAALIELKSQQQFRGEQFATLCGIYTRNDWPAQRELIRRLLTRHAAQARPIIPPQSWTTRLTFSSRFRPEIKVSRSLTRDDRV